MSDLANVLRILAKHAAACADDLDGDAQPERVPDLDDIKAQQSERRKRLGGSGA
jgi:hypothetical protein